MVSKDTSSATFSPADFGGFEEEEVEVEVDCLSRLMPETSFVRRSLKTD
jgi:hypothetical protein